jgi:hypothetical protein
MPLLPQDLVHKLEMGSGARALRIALAVLGVLALFFFYNLRAFRNFSTVEAMDQAQLAHNLARGEGYTTKFIRPFSLFLLKRTNQERFESLTPEQKADLACVKGNHPDISNPPGYPLVLAGLMKAAPFLFNFDARADRPFWWRDGAFARFQPDFVIAVFNQLLLFAVIWLTFLLARRLFDDFVAWVSALLLLGAELLWRFSVSGLSTLLLLLLFLGLVWALVRLEAAVREAAPSTRSVLCWAALTGALLAAGMLTRYAYGILLLPVLAFVVTFGGRWRLPAAGLVVAVFAVLTVPWMLRNFHLSGAPFGTATYAVLENSALFPQNRLTRSLQPDFSQIWLKPLWWKFFINLRTILLSDVFRLGGTILSGFFLVGLMFGFRNPAVSRLRYFTLMALAALVVMQAFGRTTLSDDSPELNSENLLVLLFPLVLIYGVSFFHTLLDQMTLPALWVRYVVLGVFGFLALLPMLFTFLPPRPSVVAFPPYKPPTIQRLSAWMRENELVMSDVPWAVAWYGDRQAVLLTLDAQAQFYQLNDLIKPVGALYLTPVSLDAKFLSQWALGGSEMSWGNLIINSLNRQELPPRFPLRFSPRLDPRTDPEWAAQLFLADWERWLKPEGAPRQP